MIKKIPCEDNLLDYNAKIVKKNPTKMASLQKRFAVISYEPYYTFITYKYTLSKENALICIDEMPGVFCIFEAGRCDAFPFSNLISTILGS